MELEAYKPSAQNGTKPKMSITRNWRFDCIHFVQ